MKKTELKNLAEKKPIQVRLNPKDGLSSLEQNPKTGPEKTLEANYKEEYYNRYGGIDPNDGKKGEEAEIVHEMDEIIKNNDKFETIKVLLEILCKELGIPNTNQPGAIGHAIKKVFDDYYKSMEDFRNLTKQGQKQSIRQ